MFVQDLEDTNLEQQSSKLVHDNDLISPKQVKRIFAIAGANEITIEKAEELLKSWGFASTKDIKVKDYDEICNKLENYRKER